MGVSAAEGVLGVAAELAAVVRSEDGFTVRA